MIIVNLLPEDLRPVTRTPIPYLVSGLILIGALVVMGAMWMASSKALAQERAQLAAYQKELDDLSDVVEEHNALEDQKDKLAEKIEIINEIVADRIIWSQQLWRLSKLTPDNIWFNGIHVETKKGKESRREYDKTKKQYVTKTVPITQMLMTIEGYVIPDEDDHMWFYPLTYALDNDEEFSSMFKLGGQERNVTEFEGYPALSFTLEYEITTGEEPE